MFDEKGRTERLWSELALEHQIVNNQSFDEGIYMMNKYRTGAAREGYGHDTQLEE